MPKIKATYRITRQNSLIMKINRDEKTICLSEYRCENVTKELPDIYDVNAIFTDAIPLA